MTSDHGQYILDTYKNLYYRREDFDYVQKRKDTADTLQSEGKSFKYAWYTAFKEYPRIYLTLEEVEDYINKKRGVKK